jgi:hypothetical protein
MEKSISLLEEILKDLKLDNDILKIDFQRLIKLRNSVAHSGDLATRIPYTT